MPALIEHFRSSGAAAVDGSVPYKRRKRGLSAVVADLQARSPQGVATIDLDASILASSKRAAAPCYDGGRGYQPMVALWAEQDAIVADEFRAGNVSAQSGNSRVIERALAALPEGVERVYLRADSALYDHSLMVYLDQKRVGFALSVPVSPRLMRRMHQSIQLCNCAGRHEPLNPVLVGDLPADGDAVIATEVP